MSFKTRTAYVIVALVVVSGIVGACSNDGDQVALQDSGTADMPQSERKGVGMGFDSDGAMDAESGPQPLPASDEYLADTGGGVGGSTSGVPPIGPTVIKTADIRVSLDEDEIRAAVDDAIAIAAKSGGFVISTSVSGEESDRASLVVRVPADRFEIALGDLSALGEVDHKTVTGQDVSQEFVDLEARLRNASAQEAVLLRLMDEAANVTDTIRVQSALQNVQLEVERLRGRLRYLEDQAAMSTIAISFVDAGAPAPKEQGPFERAWETAVETFVAVVSGVIVGAGFVVPIAILLGIVVVIFLPVVKRLRPRFEP
jgi:Domain of unknown function (DUF4349)